MWCRSPMRATSHRLWRSSSVSAQRKHLLALGLCGQIFFVGKVLFSVDGLSFNLNSFKGENVPVILRDLFSLICLHLYLDSFLS